MEDTYAEWTPKLGSKTDEAVCKKDNEDIDFHHKQRAVKFWRSGSAAQHRFRKVTSVRQWRRWTGQVNKGGTYVENLHLIVEYALNNGVYMVKTSLVLKIHDLKHLTGGCGGLKELTE